MNVPNAYMYIMLVNIENHTHGLRLKAFLSSGFLCLSVTQQKCLLLLYLFVDTYVTGSELLSTDALINRLSDSVQ